MKCYLELLRVGIDVWIWSHQYRKTKMYNVRITHNEKIMQEVVLEYDDKVVKIFIISSNYKYIAINYLYQIHANMGCAITFSGCITE